MSDLTILGVVQIVMGIILFFYGVHRENRYFDGSTYAAVGIVTLPWGVVAVILGLIL